MTIAVPIRIIQLSTLWNIQFIAAFSTSYYYCSHTRRCNSHKITQLQVRRCQSNFVSTSISTNMQDEEGRKEVTARRSPRKAYVESSVSSSLSFTTTTTTSTAAIILSAPASMELLEQWIQHDHHSYHLDHLSPDRAFKIRTALVRWYRANRRKLPWRGDVGPYDGSTAGYGTAAASAATGASTLTATTGVKQKKRKKLENEGKDIRSFFTTSNTVSSSSQSLSKPVKGKDKDVTELTASFQPTEVTAYGVWVSEIMLQQTRVEAVIPYWIKCKCVTCFL